jgi:hypothetical protein
VIRPLRLCGALAAAGAIGAVSSFAQVPVPRAFLAMSACLALAFSVSRRVARPPRWPAMRRAGWIIAAALMLAAMPSDVPGKSGVGAVVFTQADLLVLAVAASAVVGIAIRIVQGLRADPGDRLLGGVLAALAAFVALWVASVPPPAAGWLYPFGVLLGAAIARANGNLRVP